MLRVAILLKMIRIYITAVKTTDLPNPAKTRQVTLIYNVPVAPISAIHLPKNTAPAGLPPNTIKPPKNAPLTPRLEIPSFHKTNPRDTV